jgi:type I restriction enzyme S subunit
MMPDGFKETEIGPIPVDWELVRLETCAELVTKGSSPKWQGFEYCDDGIIFVRSQNIGWGRLELGEVARLPEEFNAKEKRSVIHQDDVLVNIVGASIGRAAVANRLIAGGNLNQAVAIVRLGEKVYPHFLVDFLLSSTGQYQLHRQKKEIARANLSLRDIKSLIIPRPALPEQRRIAHVLSTIQRAIAAQDDLIGAARETKRSLMHHLFTYGPGPEPAPTKETMFGEIPEHWQVARLDEHAFIQTGAAKGRRLNDSEVISVPYLRVANVQDGYLDLSEVKYIRIRRSETERYKLQPGDVVLTEGGDFDKLGRGFIWNDQIPNCIHQNHIFAVRVNRDILLPEYLAYLVQSEYGKAYFLSVAHRTTNLACINKTKLSALPALIPRLEEQERIAERLKVADKKISAEQQRKSVLQALFQSTLQQLMTGQIRLSDDLDFAA